MAPRAVRRALLAAAGRPLIIRVTRTLERTSSRAHRVGERERTVDLLIGTPLFDPDWYRAQARLGDVDDRTAAADYLRRGCRDGLTPHPLFDPAHYAAGLPVVGSRDPLVFYLTHPAHRRRQVHPLFRTRYYLQQAPDAKRHPAGPLGHYLEVGVSRGLRPNPWYRPDPRREPAGLVDWVRRSNADWLERRRVSEPLRRSATERVQLLRSAQVGGADSGGPLVSVILPVAGPEGVSETLRSVLVQTMRNLEVLVVGPGADDAAASTGSGSDPRVQVHPTCDSGVTAALNLGIGLASGRYLAFANGGATWKPEHLRLCLAALQSSEAKLSYDRAHTVRPDGSVKASPVGVTAESLAVAPVLPLPTVVVDRELAVRLGGFDDGLSDGYDYDFLLRAAAHTAFADVAAVGVRLPQRRRDPVRAWEKLVQNRRLIDWSGLSARGPGRHGLVSVVMPTYQDWRMTTTAVAAVVEAAQDCPYAVEVIVVDNGGSATVSTVLDSLPERYPHVAVLHSAVNRGFALGNNLALEQVRGEIVVFLNNDTVVRQHWLEPLVEALADEHVLGAQSLLVYPTGTVQSAGVAFPGGGGIPHPLLQGFPAEDAARLTDTRFQALTGAALAVRYADVVSIEGFDPIYWNGMEDVDFCLRLDARRHGHFVVCPASVVVHMESRSPNRHARSIANRRAWLDRWDGRVVGDDLALWRRCGYDVVGHEVRQVVGSEPRLSVPEPVLVRRPRAVVSESPPRLRWALRNPAPAGPAAERWGDTHFVRALARALRELGQDVVTDHRPEFNRVSTRFDDVVLLVRGLAPHAPQFGPVCLIWIISHPAALHPRDAVGFDRVFAASTSWSTWASGAWGVPVEPLLQATDPTVFNPDAARPGTGAPVLFVGGSRRVLRPMVRDAVAANLPLSVYGSEWEGLIPEHFIKGHYLPNADLAKHYRSAGVVLNDHWDDMRAHGFISNRLFDAAASGARVITDDVLGMADLFGRSVQVAHDGAGLVRLANLPDPDAVFGTDAERRSVAARVAREHSFAVRAERLLSAALEVRAARSGGAALSPR